MKNFKEVKINNWSNHEKEILAWWDNNKIFQKSLNNRAIKGNFVFYEGPPSANGLPGIHHVMARTVKDMFCRYKTMKGFRVLRKAGWDTHGLPVELEVEKKLGIRKDDVGTKISVVDFNKMCREAVMKYTHEWNELTRRMGFWLDLDNPYITYETKYIETVWYILKELYDKRLLYKGLSIQPYSPAAGTGLSSHELNQPGCYRMVKDLSVTALFKIKKADLELLQNRIGKKLPYPIYAAAWTTTPWTLPSNTGLAVNENLNYEIVLTFNPYTTEKIGVIIASEPLKKFFKPENNVHSEDFAEASFSKDRKIWSSIGHIKGSLLENLYYEQLLPYSQPIQGDNFRIVCSDFVSTEEGTGIVHIAPSFGADDFRTAKQKNLGDLTLVDKQGRFKPEVIDLEGEFVKTSYYTSEQIEQEKKKQGGVKYLSADERIVIKLKKEGKALHSEWYEHNYPHCWRTDKPVVFYPLDSWFIKTTAVRDKLIKNNNKINWKPASTGSGRFGNWLENLVDWNLSRTRFWGIPLPIWRTLDGTEEKCIGSLEELSCELDKSVEFGFMKENPLKRNSHEDEIDYYNRIDLHKPFSDQWVLVSKSGNPMYREPDLIDVWFDSGSMPYAQWHWPFENKDNIKSNFPADFIAEGVDQTRGWFFTLHTIATMLFDSPAFLNVVSNGLVLDKHGNKMSKRLGNAIDPMKLAEEVGFDAIRWYMMSNAHPWENLKFDPQGPMDTIKGFFGTLHNAYLFLAMYANVDQVNPLPYSEKEKFVGTNDFDHWILQRLNKLIEKIDLCLEEYESLPSCRAIEDFVKEELSNWYIRLNRRRFWKSEETEDKTSAYRTLFTCLETVSKLIAPVAPFYAERLYQLLHAEQINGEESVHLCDFPKPISLDYDEDLEKKMNLARNITSLALSIRKKLKIRVRQPLAKLIIPLINPEDAKLIESIIPLLKTEINVKDVIVASDEAQWVKKSVRPRYQTLGPKLGQGIKEAAEIIMRLTTEKIKCLERGESLEIELSTGPLTITKSDVDVAASDVEGYQSASDGNLTVALDITLSEELISEGLARDIINRTQNLRKELNLEVSDRIKLTLGGDNLVIQSVKDYSNYICNEVLAEKLILNYNTTEGQIFEIGDNQQKISLKIEKLNHEH